MIRALESLVCARGRWKQTLWNVEYRHQHLSLDLCDINKECHIAPLLGQKHNSEVLFSHLISHLQRRFSDAEFSKPLLTLVYGSSNMAHHNLHLAFPWILSQNSVSFHPRTNRFSILRFFWPLWSPDLTIPNILKDRIFQASPTINEKLKLRIC